MVAIDRQAEQQISIIHATIYWTNTSWRGAVEAETEQDDDEEDERERATGAFKKGYAVVSLRRLIALIPAKAPDTPRQMWGDE